MSDGEADYFDVDGMSAAAPARHWQSPRFGAATTAPHAKQLGRPLKRSQSDLTGASVRACPATPRSTPWFTPRGGAAAASAAAASSNSVRSYEPDLFGAEPGPTRWEHRGKGPWHPFPDDVEPAIEIAYQKGLPSMPFSIGGKSYVLDFKRMQQTCQSDAKCRRQVRRAPRRDVATGSADAPSLHFADAPDSIWEYRGRARWHPFSQEHDQVVEMAYNMGAQSVRIEIWGETYEIDFRNSCQVCLGSPDRRREIRRTSPPAGPSEDAIVPLIIAAIGVRVQRGPDWDRGDEDGGEGALGSTTRGEEEPGWISVQWDADRTRRSSRYRVGAEGKFDLMVLPGRPPAPGAELVPQDPRMERCREDVVRWVQQVFNKTYRPTQTRDRAGRAGPSPVPSKYSVTAVFRANNKVAWANFQRRLAEVAQHPAASRWDFDEVMTQAVPCLDRDKLEPAGNVRRLLHGSSRKNIESIMRSNLDLALAKDGLFGRAACFAESVTKADEYSPDADGPVHALVICRVALGRVHYTAEQKPDKAAINLGFAANSFDSVLNDRLAAMKTFREFAIRNAAQAFPEYLVYYERK